MTAPCIEACPSKINVPRYIDYIRDGKPENSLGVLLQKYPMAATCGRVCVRYCEMACRRKFVDEAVEHQGAEALRRRPAERPARAEIQPRHDPQAARRRHEGGGDRRRSGRHLLRLSSAAARLSRRRLRQGEPGRRHGADRHPELPTAQGYAGDGDRHHPRTREAASCSSSGSGATSRSTICSIRATRRSSSVSAASRAPRSGSRARTRRRRAISPASTSCSRCTTTSTASRRSRSMARWWWSAAAMSPWIASARRSGSGPSAVHVIYRRTIEDMPADPAEIEAAEAEGVHFHVLSNPDADRHGERQGHRRGARPHGAERARRERPAQGAPDPGQRVHHARATS